MFFKIVHLGTLTLTTDTCWGGEGGAIGVSTAAAASIPASTEEFMDLRI